MWGQIFQDAFFAAIAAIGFAAISRPPKPGYLYCAIIAALGIPAEACLFPALLPMIPGIYAYKAFGGLAMCVLCNGQDAFHHYFYLFAYNAFTCTAVLLSMVVGATMPIFIFKKVSFQATR